MMSVGSPTTYAVSRNPSWRARVRSMIPAVVAPGLDPRRDTSNRTSRSGEHPNRGSALGCVWRHVLGDADRDRLGSAMGRLLRGGDLPADDGGAVTVPILAQALTAELGTPVDLETVRALARHSKRFSLD